MKYLLLMALLVLQTPSEPYPGQSHHGEPPAGWNCYRPPVDLKGDQSHWCSCERVCDQETQIVHEDQQCTVYCHMDACKCPMSGGKRCMPEAQR